jgi:hypothetical protein
MLPPMGAAVAALFSNWEIMFSRLMEYVFFKSKNKK